eukprot:SM000198S05316  [mRNA]  locus=s198:204581:205851:+ [translate_table: standard]
MGWLTESSVMPKRKRLIEGVGAASALELRAQLYQSQEDARRRAADGGADDDDQRRRTRTPYAGKNPGVEARAHRDRLQLKPTDGSNVYAALERKAALYEKLQRGEAPDEEEKEKYSVDFLRKGTLEEERAEMDAERDGCGAGAGLRADLDLRTVSEAALRGAELARVGASAEHKQFVREVNAETRAARGKAQLLRMRRQQQAQKRQEKLKLAFIKKQAETILAARKGGGQVAKELEMS